jgi:hypothetical protein
MNARMFLSHNSRSISISEKQMRTRVSMDWYPYRIINQIKKVDLLQEEIKTE